MMIINYKMSISLRKSGEILRKRRRGGGVERTQKIKYPSYVQRVFLVCEIVLKSLLKFPACSHSL